MGTFINPKSRTEIELDENNKVWIVSKMSLKIQSEFQSELMKLQSRNEAPTAVGDFNIIVSAELAQKMVMLKHNLKKWAGPMFVDDKGKRVPCVSKNIELLDPDSNKWWIDIVAERIGELNKPETVEPDEDDDLSDPN